MTPSKFQLAIFDKIKGLQRGQNLVIQARAGSGKTSTIVKSLEMLPMTENIIFLAFNKSIATELASRVPVNVTATTLNSFGWRCCLNNLPNKPRMTEWKTNDILQRLVPNQKEFKRLVGPVKQLVGLMKAWMIGPRPAFDQMAELVGKYDIEPPIQESSFYRLVQTVYHEAVTNLREMDFDDQLYFPVMHDMTLGRFDKVFIDEAQDLNPVQIELVTRLGRSGSIVAVGDDRQAIYGFRGADPDAMDRLISGIKAEVLPLSICYRCCKTVIREAQRIVPDIEYAEWAPEGKIEQLNIEDMRKLWQDKDYVLCRVTLPLVSECLKMIQAGRRACVKGREIGKNLAELLQKICKSDDGIERQINNYRQEQLARLERLNKESEMAVLNDKCDTLLAIWESCENPDSIQEIIKKIESIFADNDAAGIIFCTVHKSKGLESRRVFILSPNLMPHPSAKIDWQIKQEMNLKYVAYTRAQEELYIESKGPKKMEKEASVKNQETLRQESDGQLGNRQPLDTEVRPSPSPSTTADSQPPVRVASTEGTAGVPVVDNSGIVFEDIEEYEIKG